MGRTVGTEWEAEHEVVWLERCGSNVYLKYMGNLIFINCYMTDFHFPFLNKVTSLVRSDVNMPGVLVIG
jgi:hypothetical protein